MLKAHAATDTLAPAPIPSDHRLRRPERDQTVWALVAWDHQARAIWAVVRTLDLSEFHAPIPVDSAQDEARAGVCGRGVTDPVLLSVVEG